MRNRRVLALTMAMAMMGITLAGCGNSGSSAPEPTNATTAAGQTAGGETESGAEDEEFSILVASGEYPDIIEYNKWVSYAGGPGAAINDGVIISLDDVFAGKAPNIKKLMEEYPKIAKSIKTSGGSYYCFPLLRGLVQPNVTQFSDGILVRKDVLDELGLELPETIDEWDTTLRAYKDYGFEVPFTTRKEWMKIVFSPGFDNWGDYYVEDGGSSRCRIRRYSGDAAGMLCHC